MQIKLQKKHRFSKMYSPFKNTYLLTLISFLISAYPIRAEESNHITSLLQYPNANSVFNPRVPAVAPVDNGASGKSLEISTDFTYALSPSIEFNGQGILSIEIRDQPKRLQKRVLELTDGSKSLIVLIQSAKDGREVLINFKENETVVSSKKISQAWGNNWTPLEIEWIDNTAHIQAKDTDYTLDLKPAFSPTEITLRSDLVDELQLSGRGVFQLNWDNGYAATVNPSIDNHSKSARLLGFDTYAVSDAPGKRSFPILQVQNYSDASTEAIVSFRVHSEISAYNWQWAQTVTIPAQSSKEVPIDFPHRLTTDIYHMTAQSESKELDFSDTKHFYFVEPRHELPGDSKFGLHDNNNRSFGSWPDALPIDFAHVYTYWSIVMGPSWIKDYGEQMGLDPMTPPEEWAWNPRVDWLIGQGHEIYLSLQSEPFLEWMREYKYPEQRLKKYDWGLRGGFPKMDLYRPFLREVAKRYKGKINYYEIENEPNAGGQDQIPPEEYAKIAKATYEEIKAIAPSAQIFGICGTGDFTPWMQKVFESDGYKYMDGVSIHTYVTPQTPESADLSGKLSEVNAIIDSTGRNLPIINSETGTYVALRETVDKAIPSYRLKELIDAGTKSVFLPTGWPNYAQTEEQGGSSVVRNAVYNFLAGAKRFIFFGYNPAWPDIPANTSWAEAKGDNGFSIISLSLKGERTPSLYTLAIGVLSEQLKAARLDGIKPIDQSGTNGAIFATQSGGETAVLWSPLGKRTILLESPTAEIDRVSLFGQTSILKQPKKNDSSATYSFALEIDEHPIYLHTKTPGLKLAPSPVMNVHQITHANGSSGVKFLLVNRSKAEWQGKIKFPPQNGWYFEPSEIDFKMLARSRTEFSVKAIAPKQSELSRFAMNASLSLPNGAPYVIPFNLAQRPSRQLAPAPEWLSPENMHEWTPTGSPALLNRPDQVVVGRPPKLSSLQEDKYWQGPAELSAKVYMATNQQGLFIHVDVIDTHASAPQPWPGVFGSAVELFFDLRAPGQGFGEGFGRGVHQVILKPALNEAEAVAIWNPDEALEGGQASGGPTDKGYKVVYYLPWSVIGRSHNDLKPIGIDIGIDGPGAKPGSRKSQLMLYGTANNNKDATQYGILLPLQ